MGRQDGKHHIGSNKYLTIKTRNTNNHNQGPTGPLRRNKMYNFNELCNLVTNSMDYEGLKFDGILSFLLEMGVGVELADDVISAINYELLLAA